MSPFNPFFSIFIFNGILSLQDCRVSRYDLQHVVHKVEVHVSQTENVEFHRRALVSGVACKQTSLVLLLSADSLEFRKCQQSASVGKTILVQI